MKRPKYKDDWSYSFGNEVGRLYQGMPGQNDGTNTMFFTEKDDVPWDRKKDATYSNFFSLCDRRRMK